MTVTDGKVTSMLIRYAKQLHNITALICMHSRTDFSKVFFICSLVVNPFPPCTTPNLKGIVKANSFSSPRSRVPLKEVEEKNKKVI